MHRPLQPTSALPQSLRRPKASIAASLPPFQQVTTPTSGGQVDKSGTTPELTSINGSNLCSPPQSRVFWPLNTIKAPDTISARDWRVLRPADREGIGIVR